MTPADAPTTVAWMTRQYGFDPKEVEEWVAHLHFNWSMSVKALDAAGEVIGLLNMSDYRIEEETEAILSEQPELLRRLDALRYTAVFSFIVAEPYRHTPLNHRMIMEIWHELEQDYDFLFVPVMHRLTTHQYWQRRGAVEFFRDSMSIYYLIPLRGKALLRSLLPQN
jgi:hypothetical protein